jgi:hypothetical protein
MLIKYTLVEKTDPNIDLLIKTFIDTELADNPGYNLDSVQMIDLKGSRSYLVQAQFLTPVSSDIDASQVVSGVLDTDRIPDLDASKITSGILNIARLPQTVFERLVIAADEAAMLALTITEVQNGDTVKNNATDIMYFVYDDSQLGTMGAFAIYKAGKAAAVDWGDVTGTLANQTDLQNALDGKVDNYSSTTVSTNTLINNTYSTYRSISSAHLTHVLMEASAAIEGRRYTIVAVGSGPVTVSGYMLQTISGYPSVTFNQGESITVEATSSGWIII